MILILIFAEAIGLYGLIVAIIIKSSWWDKKKVLFRIMNEGLSKLINSYIQ
jgi:hypothetical protein